MGTAAGFSKPEKSDQMFKFPGYISIHVSPEGKKFYFTTTEQKD